MFLSAGESIELTGEGLGPEFTKTVRLILSAMGRMIVSDIGRSGHVVRTIAAAMSSMGTPAHYIYGSPLEPAFNTLLAFVKRSPAASSMNRDIRFRLYRFQ
jgi:D-arabinose 5-phosphate isomerase GutQ